MYISCCFVVCMLIAGCSGNSPSKGDPVKVKSGETFEIKLESQIATGYRWRLADSLDARYLELVDSKYQDPDEDLAGSVGLEIWTFRALSPGKTTISLLYNPAWQKEKADDAKTRTIEVVIE